MTTPIEPRRQVILMDDDWVPPPRPSRAPVIVISTLAIACVTFVAFRAYVWAQNQSAPFEGRSAQSPRGMLWYPDDSEFGPPARAQAAQSHAPAAPVAPAAPPARPSARSVVNPPARAPVRARPVVPGQLSVNSTPWSVLWVDGHVVGNTPQVGIRVTPGRHLLVFAREGFASLTTWVSVEPGATVKMTGITLRPIAP